ncbi:MAG: hypothetical protein ACKOTZ_13420, partial [Chloroflexota bacterium]
MTVPGQLSFFGPLPGSTPDLPAADGWRELPRGWGHPFHPILPWAGAVPPAFAHALIERFTRPGDVVLDPACGRGTVPLQASLRRRVGIGIADDPLGALATAAVLDAPARREALARVAELRIGWTHARAAAMDDVVAARTAVPALAALPAATVAALLFLRAELATDERTDRFLRVALAGLVAGAGSAPAALPPDDDLGRLLELRVARLYRSLPPGTRGLVIGAGTADPLTAAGLALRARALPDRARLVIARIGSSERPGAGSDLRRWIAGVPAPVRAGAPLPEETGRLLAGLRPRLAADGVLALVLPGARAAGADAGSRARAACDAAVAAGWQVAGISVAGI